MDTSKEYIKMCERAKGIQYKKYKDKFTESDFVYDGKKVRVIGHDFLPVKHYADRPYVRYMLQKSLDATSYKQETPMDTIDVMQGEYVVETLAKGVWLPRQDQLQEKIRDEWEGTSQLAFGFASFTDEFVEITSMEQLWLAFVMKEKYSKQWSGTDWVKK